MCVYICCDIAAKASIDVVLPYCRCFGSDRAPRIAPQGAFWSRTVLSTVAQRFVLNAM
jgi:hypothetical protein